LFQSISHAAEVLSPEALVSAEINPSEQTNPMDILLSALDSRVDADSEPCNAGFADLVARVTQRIDALGTPAPGTDVSATVLDVVQDVAQFTLAWAEPENTAAAQSPTGPILRSDDTTHAERRW
jgi:hypothetical protein